MKYPCKLQQGFDCMPMTKNQGICSCEGIKLNKIG